MVDFLIGDWLTGGNLRPLRALAGSWSEVINDAGSVSCSVSLRNPIVKRMDLFNTAAVGKTFLAAVEGDTILQAGPIWDHAWNGDSRRLTLSAAGALSYWDHRALLPVLAGRLPSDPTTDTVFQPVSESWPTDTRTSLQGIMVTLLEQAMSWPHAGVPVTLPTIIPGTSEKTYRGADVAPVGQRVRELTQLLNGPEIRMSPRFTEDRTAVEWVTEIGTPDQPLIFSPQRPVFYLGADKSSVTNVSVKTSGLKLASHAFASGGRAADEALVSASTDPTLTDAGFPQLDVVDSSHSTVQELPTLQGYSDEIVARGKRPVQTWSFSHNVSIRPYLTSFRAGDFADVRVVADPYLPTGPHSMRLVARSGDITSRTVDLQFAPEVF